LLGRGQEDLGDLRWAGEFVLFSVLSLDNGLAFFFYCIIFIIPSFEANINVENVQTTNLKQGDILSEVVFEFMILILYTQ
jgi:hypothetical protein